MSSFFKIGEFFSKLIYQNLSFPTKILFLRKFMLEKKRINIKTGAREEEE